MMTIGIAGRRSGWSSKEKQEFAKGLLFISPWLIGFLIFIAYPIVASLYYSFTSYDLLRSPRFMGLTNYRIIIFEDEFIGRVLYNTLYFVVFGVPAGIIVAFSLASLLNTKLVARSVFRTIFFIPSVVPVVSSAMVWLWVFNTQYGVIDSTLMTLGLPVIPFLSSPSVAKPSLIIIHCWASGGAMLIFLASLRDVPSALYDAAEVDGAGAWARFWHITIPMCTPAILFNLLTGIIGAFQYFTFAWILTQGGPNFSTEFYSLYLYRNAFSYLKMGYASALAWFLFLIVMAVTLLTFRSSARWVYYGSATQ
jgi:multiple sugar transport system permease protein